MILLCLLGLLPSIFVLAQNNGGTSPNSFTITTLAGYKFGTKQNFTEHAQLDLDQKRIEEELDKSPPVWHKASEIYARGGNSEKSNSLRTLKGFSSEAATLLHGEPYFDLYRNYYGCPTYGDNIVSNALNNAGEFVNTNNSFRVVSAKTGTAYLNVWMYVIHELEDAIDDCMKGDLNNNDKGVTAWDEGWAFYAGSLEGADGSGDGVMIHNLAEKQCTQFGTCVETTQGRAAKVNQKALKLWKAGREKLNNGKCREAIDEKNHIVQQMTIPLVQGLLQSARSAKYNHTQNQVQTAHAEGLAFLRALLPILDHCDPRSAVILTANFHPAFKPMSDFMSTVANAIYRNLGCMGLTCDDIGILESMPKCRTASKFKRIPRSDTPAVENRKAIAAPKVQVCPHGFLLGRGAGSIPIGSIVGGVIAGIALLLIIALCALYYRRRKEKPPAGRPRFIPQSTEHSTESI